MEHGRKYEPIAREQYIEMMKLKLNRDVIVRETGLVIQPNLFWLAASPDGMVSDNNELTFFGLIEIKCPFSKRNTDPDDIVTDKKFYVGIDNGKPYLKQSHSYYTQIQMAMGLSQVTYCDFIVYTFKGMMIVRTPLDREYFKNMVEKLSIFYKKELLPAYLENAYK